MTQTDQRDGSEHFPRTGQKRGGRAGDRNEKRGLSEGIEDLAIEMQNWRVTSSERILRFSSERDRPLDDRIFRRPIYSLIIDTMIVLLHDPRTGARWNRK